MFNTLRTDIKFVGTTPYLMSNSALEVEITMGEGFRLTSIVVKDNSSSMTEFTLNGSIYESTLSFNILADTKITAEFSEISYIFVLYHAENKSVPSNTGTTYVETITATSNKTGYADTVIGYFGTTTVLTTNNATTSRLDGWYYYPYDNYDGTFFPESAVLNSQNASYQFSNMRENFILIANYTAVYTVTASSYYKHTSTMGTGNNTFTPGGDELGFVDITNTAVETNKYDVGTAMQIVSDNAIDTNSNVLWAWYFKQTGDTIARLFATYSIVGNDIVFSVQSGYTTGDFEDANYAITVVGGVITLTFDLNNATSGDYYAVYKKYYQVSVAVNDLTSDPEGTGSYGTATATITNGYQTYDGLSNFTADYNQTPVTKWLEYGSVVTFSQTAVIARNYVFKYWTSTTEFTGENTDPSYNITVQDTANIVANFVQTFSVLFTVFPDDSGSIVLSDTSGTFEEGTVITATVTALTGFRFSRITKDDLTVVTNATAGITVNNRTISVTINKDNAGTYVFEFITLYYMNINTISNGLPTTFPAR